jgi:hypothetical protein
MKPVSPPRNPRYLEPCAPVAQLDRARSFYLLGRGFDSLRARQLVWGSYGPTNYVRLPPKSDARVGDPRARKQSFVRRPSPTGNFGKEQSGTDFGKGDAPNGHARSAGNRPRMGSQTGTANARGNVSSGSWSNHVDGDRSQVVVRLLLKMIPEPFVKSDVLGHQLISVESCAAKPQTPSKLLCMSHKMSAIAFALTVRLDGDVYDHQVRVLLHCFDEANQSLPFKQEVELIGQDGSTVIGRHRSWLAWSDRNPLGVRPHRQITNLVDLFCANATN